MLRQPTPDAERARELALHALTLRDPRFPAGRVEDWTSFAIASALTGRERDARAAWFVTLALTPNLERHCRGAMLTRWCSRWMRSVWLKRGRVEKLELAHAALWRFL